MGSLNDLINLARTILASGFDTQAFLAWQVLACTALAGVLGPTHYYTLNFKQLTSEKNPLGLLAGQGILVAAKEEMSKAHDESHPNERTGEHKAA